MKRIASLLMTAALALNLAACSGGESTAATESATPTEAPAATETPVATEASADSTAGEAAESEATADAAETDTAETTGSNILVAYFSWSGNTETMANMIAEDTGGTLFTIEPATPYTDDYDTLLDVAQQEQADNARPELATEVQDWDSYDVVFVGYPDWWSDAPMLIYSFLESYDWTGKTLIPFCTSGGSGFGRSLDKLPDSAPGATILDGLHVSGSSVDGAADQVADWAAGLGL